VGYLEKENHKKYLGVDGKIILYGFCKERGRKARLGYLDRSRD
jgi:hypothetical protein